MKTIVGLYFVCAVLSAVCFGRPQEKYSTKYDSLDIDKILHNERLLDRYVNCLLTDKGCTPDINDLKGVLQEALKTECAKCSAVQKAKAEKAFVFVFNNKRDVFDKLAEKFDPNGEHRKHYKSFAAQRGIQL